MNTTTASRSGESYWPDSNSERTGFYFKSSGHCNKATQAVAPNPAAEIRMRVIPLPKKSGRMDDRPKHTKAPER